MGRAQEKIPPFPTEVTMDEKRLASTFEKAEIRGGLAEAEQFQIVLESRSWTRLPAGPPLPSVELPVLQSLARFGREAPKGFIEIYHTSLAAEVAPADWLERFTQELGWREVTSRTLRSRYGRVKDALYRYETNLKVVMARAMAIKDGKSLFLFTATCFDGDYRALADEFLICMSGFRLLNPTRERYAEASREYPFERPVRVAFTYLESWTPKPDPTSHGDAASVSLRRQVNGQTVGRVDVSVVGERLAPGPAEAAEAVISLYREQGLPIGDRTREATSLSEEAGWATYDCEFGGTKEEGSGRLLCRTLECPGAWITVTCLGPSREESAEVAATNRRAFEIAAETIRPLGE